MEPIKSDAAGSRDDAVTNHISRLSHDAQAPDRQEGFDAEQYIESFSALKSSVSQGRDLKKKRKALEEYQKTLDTLKAAYADRTRIAQSYDEVVREQEIIIDSTNSELEQAQDKLAVLDRKVLDAKDSLSELRRDLDQQRRPLEEELDRCNVAYSSAKDELKQVKAQRDSLELFEDGSDSAQQSEAAHDAVVANVNEKLEVAKAAQRQAQKALDAREKEDRTKVKRAQEAIKALDSDREKTGKHIDELSKKIATCQERIAFCDHVIAHPEETQSMQARIAENEKTVQQMSIQISQLAQVHAKSKVASRKARIIVAAAVILLVVCVAFFIYVSNS